MNANPGLGGRDCRFEQRQRSRDKLEFDAVSPHAVREGSTASVSPSRPKSLRERVRQVHDGEVSSVDASADAWTVLLGMLQRGYERADVIEHTFTLQAPGLRHYRSFAKERGHAAAVRKIDHDIRRACRFIALNPAGSDRFDTRARLAEMVDAMELRPSWFPGKAGTTDFVVLRNLIAIAVNANSLRFTASCRQVALAAGINSTAASHSLRRLANDGRFVRLVAEGSGPKPSTYELRMPAEAADDLPDFLDEAQARPSTPLVEIDDSFACRNLSPGPGRTLGFIGARPVTSAEIAEMTARSPSTVSAHLRRLVGHGLIKRVATGFVRVRDRLARPKPVRDVRRQAFAEQRIRYWRWLEARRRAHWRAATSARERRDETGRRRRDRSSPSNLRRAAA